MPKYLFLFSISAFVGLIFSFTGCISTKSWKPGQYLLLGQSVAGNSKVATEDIESLFRQKPNRRIFTALPYLWLYNFGKRFHKPANVQRKLENTEKKFAQLFKDNRNDIEKIQKLRKKKDRKIAKLKKRIDGNFVMRVMGEPPTFYDTLVGRKTAEEISFFMKTKGFFDANVTIKTKIKRKRIWVTYQIDEGQPTYIADVDWMVPDSGVYKTIQKDIANSRIKVDNIYDENKLTEERTRIEKLLRDNGYFDFSRSYVAFDVDTNLVDSSGRGRKVAEVDVYVSDPVNNTHKAYVLDKVYFHTISADQFATKRQKDTLVFYPKFAKRLTEQDTIHYIYEGKRMAYSPRVLYKKIRIFPKQLYSNTATIATQGGLLGLDMFKFVNISFDTTKRSFVANIFTSPLDKYQFSNEGGFNVAQGPPGPFVHFSLRNRNVFRGCELFENDFQFLFDGQTGFSSETNFYNSQEISFNSALIIPQLLIPTRLRFAFLNLNPRTRINIGFNFVRRPEYTRANIRSALVYTFQKNFHAFNLTPIDLSVVNTLNTSPAFADILDSLRRNGNPIGLSFDQALVSSSSFTYTFNNAAKEKVRNIFLFRLQVETGGNSIDALARGLGNNNTDRIFGLRYFQFNRFSLTVNYTKKLRKELAIAFRLQTGVARPVGNSTSLPYEKFFFSGGNSSIRAWAPRRLGPGSFGTFDSTGRQTFLFEQPGEIIFEANFEYRFPLFSYLKGALFIDAGNVWTIDSDAARPGANFQANRFIREIAVGTGFGIRFDLSFLVIRLDFGIKVYNPALPPERRFVLPNFDFSNLFANEQMLLNIGIGYPF